MYDIQFVIPVSTTGKYAQRLEDFIQYYGFYNVKNRKIKIYFLIGTNNVNNISFNNELISLNSNKNCSVHIELVPSKNDHLVVKVYEFFSKMTIEQANEAKWTAKIDDDAFNDIDEMMNILEEYDYEEKNFLVPGPAVKEDWDHAEIKCIENLNLQNKIWPNVFHELEGCWLSKKTMSQIVQNEDCKNLFKERIKYEYGFTDQCLAIASKLTKTPVQKEKRFYAEMSILMPINETTIFRGKLAHYHPVCRDKNLLIFNLFKNKITNVNNEKDKLFENKSYLIRFKKSENGKEFYNLSEVFFKNNIIFHGGNLQNWIADEENLIILDWCHPIATFPIKELLENKKSKNNDYSIYEVEI